MQIGRKVYYELATGNVILDTGERQGAVVETTEEQDFAMYAALQPYQQSAVGVIQLAYGQDAQNFGKYPYHVDITQNPPVIVWDTTATDLANAQTQKKAQLHDMYLQTLAEGFISSASGTSTTYGWTSIDQQHIQQLRDAIKDGLETFPITDYADINGILVTLSDQAAFTQLETDAKNFALAQLKQLRTLVGQVMAATTVDEVNAVQWSAAPYTHS
ncbi:MAG: hypothetical protein K6T83_01250 [Alicyclobacillus sp.]|nr:hypothetical protein [Alicyclobacillus sp.]